MLRRIVKPAKTHYACQECGALSPKWQGQCSACGKWNSIIEEKAIPSSGPAVSYYTTHKNPKPVLLNAQNQGSVKRESTGIGELDRVLGGGIVPGSYTLAGGAPGIGKSTLLLQMTAGLARQNIKTLYVSAEESTVQTQLRAKRLSLSNTKDNIYLLNETNLNKIFQEAEKLKPQVLIVDSIQTVEWPELGGAVGTLSQVRECAGQLMQFAKNTDRAVFIVGHITKEGELAGPKVLEHTVDTVLSFDGDTRYEFRILRALKNRFGSTNEIGVFQMSEAGLKEVKNPSEYFLAQRNKDSTGSVVFTAMEGSRPLLCEIQALTLPSYLSMPRRTSIGIDINRLHKITAVLDKYLKTYFSKQDVFLNVAGGLKVTEPGADLAAVTALLSAKKNKPVDQKSCFFGEVGLTGEIRACTFSQNRIKEAEKLGFKNIYLPAGNKKHISESPAGCQLHFLKSIKDLNL